MGTSRGRGPFQASLRRQRLRCLEPSPTGIPSWSRPVLLLATSTNTCRLRPPPTVAPIDSSPGKVPFHFSSHRHANVASGHLLPVHLVGGSLGRGSLPRRPLSARLCWLQPLPPELSGGASSGNGPCHNSLRRHDYAASGRLQIAHVLGASPGRGPCHASLHRQ